MSDKPMTAEEIWLRFSLAQYGDMEAYHRALLAMFDWMSAREREHAELVARVERLEKEADDGR